MACCYWERCINLTENLRAHLQDKYDIICYNYSHFVVNDCHYVVLPNVNSDELLLWFYFCTYKPPLTVAHYMTVIGTDTSSAAKGSTIQYPRGGGLDYFIRGV